MGWKSGIGTLRTGRDKDTFKGTLWSLWSHGIKGWAACCAFPPFSFSLPPTQASLLGTHLLHCISIWRGSEEEASVYSAIQIFGFLHWLLRSGLLGNCFETLKVRRDDWSSVTKDVLGSRDSYLSLRQVPTQICFWKEYLPFLIIHSQAFWSSWGRVGDMDRVWGCIEMFYVFPRE